MRRFAERSGVEPVIGGSQPNLGAAVCLVGMSVAGTEGYETYREVIGPDPRQGAASERLTWEVHTVETQAVRRRRVTGALQLHLRALAERTPDRDCRDRRALHSMSILWGSNILCRR
jgi:hypothetical protein